MQNQTHTNATLNATANEHAAPLLNNPALLAPIELKFEELMRISGGSGGSTDAPKTTW